MFKKANDQKGKLPTNYDKTKYYRMIADFDHLLSRNIKIIREIGRGGYGVVYKAQNLEEDGAPCAIKIPFSTIFREQIAIQIRILLLTKSKDHIACIRQVIEERNTFHLVLDYYPHTPFINFFHDSSLIDVAHYLYELLLGLKELKQIGIYHRDIKPANFLYNKQTKRGKIIDFGLAEVDKAYIKKLQQQTIKLKQSQNPQYWAKKEVLHHYQRISDMLQKTVGTLKLGTESFMPLESLLMMDGQSYASDIWPVGVIFLQCATRRYSIFNSLKYPIYGTEVTRELQLVNYILQLSVILGRDQVIDSLGAMNIQCQLPTALEQVDLKQICTIPEFDDIALDLMRKLLKINPKDRISVQQALDHEFFDSVRVMHFKPYDEDLNDRRNRE